MNSTEKTKHKWYDVIVAWASGEKIQCRYIGNEWFDLSEYIFENNPDFSRDDLEWRVKPRSITKRYRMALISICKPSTTCIAVDITNSTLDDPIEYKVQGFIRWVGDSADVEIEV